MMTRPLLARCAPIAIAASAALPVTPVFAQDTAIAEPVIVLPPADAPAATTPPATPAIVLPDPLPESAEPTRVIDAPVERSVPEQRQPAPAPRVRSAPETAPAMAATQAGQDAVAPFIPAAPTTAQTLPVEAAALPVAEPLTPRAEGTNEALIAGVLAALGIAAVGGVALAASRRRRRRDEYRDAVTYDVTDTSHLAQPSHSMSAAPANLAAPAPVTAQRAVPFGTAHARASGDPISLPAEMPQTFEERDALLKALVAARPDRANPFTGARARARRAKLIMQSLGQDFRSRKPRIDLSEYTHRWPALRGWQPATA